MAGIGGLEGDRELEAVEHELPLGPADQDWTNALRFLWDPVDDFGRSYRGKDGVVVGVEPARLCRPLKSPCRGC